MTSLKKFKKKTLVGLALRRYPKIVVASTGRAGSTMLCDSIANSIVKDRFHGRPDGAIAKLIRRWCFQYVVRLETLPDEVGYIFKTHDTFSPQHIEKVKYVFLYGDPLDSAKSVEQVVMREGQSWFQHHQYHLRGQGAFGDLYKADVLNYQGQLESWLTQTRDDVMCIDYDDLWNEQEKLSQFLGFRIDLPAKHTREPKANNNIIDMELFDGLRKHKQRLKAQYVLAHKHIQYGGHSG